AGSRSTGCAGPPCAPIRVWPVRYPAGASWLCCRGTGASCSRCRPRRCRSRSTPPGPAATSSSWTCPGAWTTPPSWHSPRTIGPAPDAGPLAPLLADPQVTDVFVNGVEVWVDRGAGPRRAAVRVGGHEDVRRLAQRLAAMAGRRLDDGSPFADVRLPDGTRLHAVLPPIARTGPYLSLRTFRARAFTLAELVSTGTLDTGAAALLAAIVTARLAYLV